jgi:hypothetical protein
MAASHSTEAVAVGTALAGGPRTDPYVQHYRIRLPPRVNGGEAAEAASRTRDARNDTPIRLCVRGVALRRSFPLADPLPSTDSAGLRPLFARFPGTMRSSDFPGSLALLGYGWRRRSRAGRLRC